MEPESVTLQASRAPYDQANTQLELDFDVVSTAQCHLRSSFIRFRSWAFKPVSYKAVLKTSNPELSVIMPLITDMNFESLNR